MTHLFDSVTAMESREHTWFTLLLIFVFRLGWWNIWGISEIGRTETETGKPCNYKVLHK